MRRFDETIYELWNGRMSKIAEVSPDRGAKNHFVIVCDFGDWSGFRTLDACIAQFPELEKNAKEQNRKDGYYRVVERL